MNKQEAIEINEQDKMKVGRLVETNSGAHSIQQKMKLVDYVPLEVVVNVINQIHEPQKVVVPKFVAEWYERNKDDLNTAIYSTITKTYRKVNGENDDLLDVFEEWLVYEDNSILILVQMQFFGFKIEQEKLYTVEIPNPNRTTEPIIYLSRDEGGKIFLNNWFLHVSQNWKNQPHAQLAESEIKKDFAWAWQFREEVE
ncbi:TPA: DUF1642 domain-containing protein [Streptococcus suis]|nr:DUF1642 domain-containing protein [Streptococcus suis]